MAQPLTVAFPPDLILSDGWIVTITAVNPTTGVDVAGVRIVEALIEVEQLAGGDLSSGLFRAINPVLVVQT